MRLDALKPGQYATLGSIDAEQALHQRLKALGFIAGKRVQVVRQAAFGGPLHVRIGTTDVMMRVVDAQRIHIQPLSIPSAL